MRLVSMVPSWTETLVEAGVDVVGRTRFCVQPRPHVRKIPVVGGTKDWDFNKIRELKPDLILLDREENPKFMAEQKEFPWTATHITNVHDVAPALADLAERLGNFRLSEFSKEWKSACSDKVEAWDWRFDPPGLIEWGQQPVGEIRRILYVIWRDPWMVVSRDTFIGSMLSRLGLGGFVDVFDVKYPKLDLAQIPAAERASTLLLFSSEPFPFLKRKKGLADMGFPHAFVAGDQLSWFGVRSLRFLQSAGHGAGGDGG